MNKFRKYLDQLSDTNKGVLLLLAGFLLLSFQLHWSFLEGLRAIISFGISIFALICIACGIQKLGAYEKLMELKKRK